MSESAFLHATCTASGEFYIWEDDPAFSLVEDDVRIVMPSMIAS